MKVLKFGGTSVGTPKNILNVKQIVESANDQVIVVVSALGGITDKLLETSRLAASGDVAYEKGMTEIISRHLDMVSEVLPEGTKRDEVMIQLNKLLNQLHVLFRDVFACRELSVRMSDAIVSYGERMSSLIASALIKDAHWYNSLAFIKTEVKHHKTVLDGKLTDSLIREAFRNMPKVALVPGFISTDRISGEVTNLGRGGSDYTAAILAAALDADCLEIWTDVDGFLTADPRVIPSATRIQELSYSEAEELCNFGAKVVYPPTIYPVWYKNIPIFIRNTMNPTAPGTVIRQAVGEKMKQEICFNHSPVKGISSMAGTCLITVNSEKAASSIDENLNRLTEYLTAECINLLLVAESKACQKVSIGVKKEDADLACFLLKERLGEGCTLEVHRNLATIGVVGENLMFDADRMKNLLHILQNEGCKVVACNSKVSDTSFSFMVDDDALFPALKRVHECCF